MTEDYRPRIEKRSDGLKYLVLTNPGSGPAQISETELLKYLPRIYGNGGENKNVISREDLDALASGEGFVVKKTIPLTKRQREVIEFIHEYRIRNSISPTYKEIGEKFGITIITVYYHVQALMKKGAVTNIKNRDRSVVPLIKV